MVEQKTITFVTRVHPKRSKMLALCKESIRNQTSDDYEHILLYDKTENGCGMHKANQMFLQAEINTKYAMVLDDDDILIYPDFVADIRKIAQTGNYDLIIFKGRHKGHGVLPPKSRWKKSLECGSICSFCMAIRKEFWDEYIHVFGNRWPCGDFDFMEAVYNARKSAYWLDKIVAQTVRISHGKAD